MKAWCSICTYHIYIFIHPLFPPFLLPALPMKFPSFSFSYTSSFYSLQLLLLQLLPNKCENCERKAKRSVQMVRSVSMLNFLCAFTMLLPFKVCFMHYIWTLRSYLYSVLPYIFRDIEKYCYRTYLFFVTECVQWECAIECATYKPNILIYTQK